MIIASSDLMSAVKDASSLRADLIRLSLGFPAPFYRPVLD